MGKSHFIKDQRGLIAGRIDEDENSRRAYDARGLFVGRYDRKNNHTYDQRGMVVSTAGDILSSLIFGRKKK